MKRISSAACRVLPRSWPDFSCRIWGTGDVAVVFLVVRAASHIPVINFAWISAAFMTASKIIVISESCFINNGISSVP